MALKVILNQDILTLGEEGDICTVANGYGRNYLLPQGLAVPYNKKYINIFEQKKDSIEKKKEEKRKSALGLKEKIEEIEGLEILMPAGDSGKLFGSVNNAVIADALAKQGVSIEKKKIEVPENTIKMTGNFTVKVKLYGSESAALKVVISATEVKDEK